MKRLSMMTATLLAALTVSAQKMPMMEYVDHLMSTMTLEEKIGQLNLLPGNDIAEQDSVSYHRCRSIVATGFYG